MDALAVGFAVTAASAGLLASLVGSVVGVIVWKFQFRLVFGVAASWPSYLVLSVPASGMVVAVVYGIPLLTLSLLFAWLTAHQLHNRVHFRPIVAVFVALIAALLLGLLHVVMLRLHFWVPVLTALAGVTYCVRLSVNTAKAATQ
jgi:hypothetical protein